MDKSWLQPGEYDPAEFNITNYITSGNNVISVEVFRWSDAAYIEDQDFLAVKWYLQRCLSDAHSRHPHQTFQGNIRVC